MIPYAPILSPETELFIYCVQGIVTDEMAESFPDFLGNWVEADHSFLFFLQPSDRTIESMVEAAPGLRLIDRYRMSYEQWQGGIAESIEIGNLVICSPWSEESVRDGKVKIMLDPGVVFGTGTHQTTIDCLEAIQIACSGGKVDTMLDLGTGTGVLAVAGAKLGCRRVIGVDYTFLAARTAQQNIIHNRVQNRVVLINGKAEDFCQIPADLLVANIGCDVLETVIQRDGLLNQKWFVLSGLLPREADTIRRLLAAKPVHLLKRWGKIGSWQTLLGITAA